MTRFHGALQLPTLLLCCALHFIFSRQPACPENGAGCTLSARDLVQRLCFFSGGTV
jgi:hypothetical protein